MTDSTGAEGRARVIVGVFPGQQERVVSEAARFAARFQAELVCAHADTGRYVVSERADGSVTSLPFDPDLPDLRDAGFDPALAGRLRDLLDGAGVRWSTRTLAGEPADALARLADTLDAIMIVVGSRRPGLLGGLHEFFAGSVAAHLAHRQARPVVVVPVSPVAPGRELPWE
jgi:nucleotide-binding universal stress UspA family protein